jgi:RHS repeat-associated protein
VRVWFAEREALFVDGTEVRSSLHLSSGGTAVARVVQDESGTEIELQYVDPMQSLMLSVSDDHTVRAGFLYSPFGEVIWSNGDVNHRRQFNGKESDRLTGLRYYGFRYYDPVSLRWNSADPLLRFAPDVDLTRSQQQNLYQFSLNNPLRFYDPNGLQPGSKEEEEREKEDRVSNDPSVLEALEWEVNLACYPPISRCNDTKATLAIYRKTGTIQRFQNLDGGPGPFNRAAPWLLLCRLNPRACFASILAAGSTSSGGFEGCGLVAGTAAGCTGARGLGALPVGSQGGSQAWTRVSRWMSDSEAKVWLGRSSMPQPGSGSGLPPRTYVTGQGIPKPGGTGPVRVDFDVPTHALKKAGKPGWLQVFNQDRLVPIKDVLLIRPE